MSNDLEYRKYLINFVQRLEPRFYRNQIIQGQYEEVSEVLYVTSGSIFVSYRLFNEIFQAICIKANQNVIGDFSCLYNKVSEFMYQAHENIYGFAMSKKNFLKIMNHRIGKQQINNIKHMYVNNIRNLVNDHRLIQSKKFKSRSDYVDLSVFGVKH